MNGPTCGLSELLAENYQFTNCPKKPQTTWSFQSSVISEFMQQKFMKFYLHPHPLFCAISLLNRLRSQGLSLDASTVCMTMKQGSIEREHPSASIVHCSSNHKNLISDISSKNQIRASRFLDRSFKIVRDTPDTRFFTTYKRRLRFPNRLTLPPHTLSHARVSGLLP